MKVIELQQWLKGLPPEMNVIMRNSAGDLVTIIPQVEWMRYKDDDKEWASPCFTDQNADVVMIWPGKGAE